MINVIVQRSDIRVVNTEQLISGTANAFYMQFSFSEEWKALNKTVVLTNGVQTIDVLEHMWQSDNICAIPCEVLKIPNKLVRVGFRGTLGNDQQLATPMAGVGTVCQGTDPTGDLSTDPTLPVWEQLREDLNTRSRICSTMLEKLGSEDDTTVLRVHLVNPDVIPSGAALHLYRCVRNRGRRSYWQHPVTWNGDGQYKWGYGLIAGKVYAYSGDSIYPEVPEWMPTDGFLNTERTIMPADRKRKYIDLNLSTFLLPLLKPVGVALNWESCGLVGLQGNGESNPLLLRFRICKNGVPIDVAGDTFRIGLKNQFRSRDNQPYLINGKLNGQALYCSIN